MKCEDVDKLMVDYLDKNMDREMISEVEAHLATCERCLDAVRDTKELFNLMHNSETIKPDDTLRINFYHMLHGEMNKPASVSEEKKVTRPVYNFARTWYGIAAGIAILVAGTFVGMFISSRAGDSRAASEISLLRTEISDLKKTTMMTMLRDESSSDRIQAVRYVEDIDNPDQNIIDALIKTLNNDRNVNVRMAAAYTLSKYAGQRMVCDSLVKSLSLQTDPILQVTLINILAERKEKSALEPIQKIIANKNTIKEVRAVAENSLRVLI